MNDYACYAAMLSDVVVLLAPVHTQHLAAVLFVSMLCAMKSILGQQLVHALTSGMLVLRIESC